MWRNYTQGLYLPTDTQSQSSENSLAKYHNYNIFDFTATFVYVCFKYKL